eukprot:2647858-Rhodomonas_salina.10
MGSAQCSVRRYVFPVSCYPFHKVARDIRDSEVVVCLVGSGDECVVQGCGSEGCHEQNKGHCKLKEWVGFNVALSEHLCYVLGQGSDEQDGSNAYQNVKPGLSAVIHGIDDTVMQVELKPLLCNVTETGCVGCGVGDDAPGVPCAFLCCDVTCEDVGYSCCVVRNGSILGRVWEHDRTGDSRTQAVGCSVTDGGTPLGVACGIVVHQQCQWNGAYASIGYPDGVRC